MTTPEDYPDDGEFNPDEISDGLDAGCPGTSQEQPDVEGTCGCLADSIRRIATAQETIAAILNAKLNSACDSIDDCFETIYDKLKQRIEGPIYAASECQRMVANGQAGTIEYAVRCAHNVADSCDATCSLGDSDSEGKCCKTCGQERCVCQAGECVPAPPPETPPEQTPQYVGYCEQQTGIVLVLPVGSQPPPGYSQVSVGKTESEARAIAESACGFKPLPKPKFDLPRSTSAGGIPCDIKQYRNGDIYNALSVHIENANLEASLDETLIALSDVGIAGLTTGDLGKIVQSIVQGVSRGPLLAVDGIALPFSNMIGCGDSKWRGLFKALGSVAAMEKYSGVSLDPWTLPYKYAMNALCPQRHLTPDQAMQAFLAGTIGPETLTTIWRMHGGCDEFLAEYTSSLRRKPDPIQLAIMRHRNYIDDATYLQKMRELGFLDPSDATNLYGITTQVPVLSDIIRFMVRDADDAALVAQFGLDSQFNQKFGKQLKQWANDQGLDELYARYAWRSHWAIP